MSTSPSLSPAPSFANARGGVALLSALLLVMAGCGGPRDVEPIAEETTDTTVTEPTEPVSADASDEAPAKEQEAAAAAEAAEPTATPVLPLADDTAIDVGLTPGIETTEAAAMADGNYASEESQPEAAPAVAETTPEADPSGEDAQLQKLLGSWTLDYHGDWVCTLEEGGGGSITVTWDWAASFLYGKSIDFTLEWSYEDGVLKETLASGTPVANYDALVRDYGDTREYEVLEVTDSTLRVRSIRDDEISVWKRKKS